MLSSIHPLGERAKGNSFSSTATAFVVGAVAGGASTGLVGGALGVLARRFVDESSISTFGVTAIVTVALVAVVFEWTGVTLPSLHRQVDENWLQEYRGWVYGVGFGFQLGAGVLTYITSAAVPVVVAATVLSGSLPASIAVAATFGLVRGLSIVPARRIDTPGRLVAFHRSLHRTAPAVRRASTIVLGATAVAAGLLSI